MLLAILSSNSYDFFSILLLLLIIGLIVGGIVLGQPIMWISGIVLIIIIIIWATLILLEATKALGKSIGGIIKKFILQDKNEN